MIPPTSIDGTDITGATIDGTDVQEITVDGDTVFSAEITVTDSFETYPSGWTEQIGAGDMSQESQTNPIKGSVNSPIDGSFMFATNFNNSDAIATYNSSPNVEFGTINGFILADTWSGKGPYGFVFRYQNPNNWIHVGVAGSGSNTGVGDIPTIIDGSNNLIYQGSSAFNLSNDTFHEYNIQLKPDGGDTEVIWNINGSLFDSHTFTPSVTGPGLMGVGQAVSSSSVFTNNGMYADLITFTG